MLDEAVGAPNVGPITVDIGSHESRALRNRWACQVGTDGQYVKNHRMGYPHVVSASCIAFRQRTGFKWQRDECNDAQTAELQSVTFVPDPPNVREIRYLGVVDVRGPAELEIRVA